MDQGTWQEHEAIRRNVAKFCERSVGNYRVARDREGGVPEDFVAGIARDGRLGLPRSG